MCKIFLLINNLRNIERSVVLIHDNEIRSLRPSFPAQRHQLNKNTQTNSFYKISRNQLKGFYSPGENETSHIKASRKIHGTHSPQSLPLPSLVSNKQKKIPKPPASLCAEKFRSLSLVFCFSGGCQETGFCIVSLGALMGPSIL